MRRKPVLTSPRTRLGRGSSSHVAPQTSDFYCRAKKTSDIARPVAIYAAGGVVLWPQALMMMVAATAGGYGGARVARKLPPAVLRLGIVATGLAMSLVFFARQ